jgi:hypothetical protein
MGKVINKTRKPVLVYRIDFPRSINLISQYSQLIALGAFALVLIVFFIVVFLAFEVLVIFRLILLSYGVKKLDITETNKSKNKFNKKN